VASGASGYAWCIWLCVAHIEMRHKYICTNGVAMVAHTICATHSSNWCATNSLFSTSAGGPKTPATQKFVTLNLLNFIEIKHISHI
jgi:hypothetical protein